MGWVVRWMRILVGTWGECVGLGGCGYEGCGLGEGERFVGAAKGRGVALGSEGGRNSDR